MDQFSLERSARRRSRAALAIVLTLGIGPAVAGADSATDAGYEHGGARCVECHAGATIASHPIGVAPEIVVPSDMPLNSAGHLACETCHIPDGNRHGELRGDSGGAPFCETCHDAEFFARMPDGGQSVRGIAHQLSPIGPNPPGALAGAAACMGCHFDDATAGSHATMNFGSDPMRTGHPIGVDYARAYRFGGYHEPATLPASIVLLGGQVSCVSCHQAYSQNHGALTTADSPVGLCLQCHDL